MRSRFAVVVALTAAGTVWAGQLAPPAGPVAETGRFGPRVELSQATTPGNATTTFIIDEPGSYYVAGHITGEIGKTAISIIVSNVHLDLNGFKAINDEHGHAAGDLALEAISDKLVSHLRETDAIGRLGGDEFGVVLTLTPTHQAEHKAEELGRLISETTITHEGKEISLSAAWGVHALERGTRLDEAMAEAGGIGLGELIKQDLDAFGRPHMGRAPGPMPLQPAPQPQPALPLGPPAGDPLPGGAQ